jgi:hypothetical protein
MTNRQIVISVYPKAYLEYWARPFRQEVYEIRTCRFGMGESKVIAKGRTRDDAWKNAKKKIQTKI